MLIRFSLRYFESNLKKSISYVFIVMCPLLFISCLSNSDSQAEGKEDVKKNAVIIASMVYHLAMTDEVLPLQSVHSQDN